MWDTGYEMWDARWRKGVDMKRAIYALAVAVLVGGCAEQAKEEKPRSSAGQAIDYMTGKTAVDAGKKARATIEGVSAQKEDDLDEVLE